MGEITMQKLKEQRMTPAEKFVLETIKDAKPEESNGKCICWYNKDGEWIFTESFQNSALFLSTDISGVLDVVYDLNCGEITQLINRMLHKYTNNGQLDIIW